MYMLHFSGPIHDFNMEQIKGSPKVEFANLIALALKKSIPWNTLSVFIDSTTLNEEQSKDVIKILLKKLEQLHEIDV